MAEARRDYETHRTASSLEAQTPVAQTPVAEKMAAVEEGASVTAEADKLRRCRLRACGTTAAVVLCAVLVGAGVWWAAGHSQERASIEGRTVKLLALGDWGRCGEYLGTSNPYRKAKASKKAHCDNQTRLASVMAATAAEFGADSLLSVGDAFYGHGIDNVYDDNFDKSFTDIYDQDRFHSLDIPWHSIMGNHEHHSPNISVLLDPALQQRDPRWHAYFEGTLSFPTPEAPLVEVVMFDATPMSEKYLGQAGAKPGDKMEHPFTEQRKRNATPGDAASWRAEVQGQLDRLEARLSASRARGVRWLLVLGHNPIRSRGTHGDDPGLVALVDPLLWKYGVHAYLNGHDHHTEHAEWPVCCEFRQAPHVPAGGPVVINEAVDHDHHGEKVELYNAGNETVNITGWTLLSQSHAGEPVKVDVVQQTMGPGTFLVFEAEMKDGNEHLWLRDAAGNVVSELAWGFGQHGNGFSVGRYPDGSSGPVVAMGHSPNSANLPGVAPQPHALEGAPASFNVSGWLPAAPARPRERAGQCMHYFTVGGGSGLFSGEEILPSTVSHNRFFRRSNAFLTIEASQDELTFKFIDDHGQEIHSAYVVGEEFARCTAQ